MIRFLQTNILSPADGATHNIHSLTPGQRYILSASGSMRGVYGPTDQYNVTTGKSCKIFFETQMHLSNCANLYVFNRSSTGWSSDVATIDEQHKRHFQTGRWRFSVISCLSCWRKKQHVCRTSCITCGMQLCINRYFS